MTQEATPVGGDTAPAEPTNEEFFADLATKEFGLTDEEEEQPAEGEPVEGEAADDDLEIEEEADDLPPIEAPVSWDAEAKETFKSLPREAQEIVAKREGERERFVQQKSQEAVRAKTEVEQVALQQLAEIEKGYAQHYEKFAQQVLPQQPNPVLLDQQSPHYNPQAFYAQQYAYEGAVAQQRELQQTAQQYAEQARSREQQAEQVRLSQEHQVIVEQFPEYTDPTTGPELQRKLSAAAKRIGYPDELISQARATDIIAMRKVADALDKADKYDALQAKKMEKVRAAKGLPRVATPGVAQGADQLRARSAQAAFETARTSKDRNVQGAAFLDFLEKTGQIK